MNQHFSTLTIIGVGLLGGSLGLAAKQRRLVDRVLGVGRRKESIAQALAAGAIDEAFTDPTEPLTRSDLVVICTPASQVIDFLDAALEFAAPGAVVTDVASTKSEVCKHAHATWPSPRRFVGAHPMAGSEKYGPEHADAALYEDAVCFLEQGDGIAADAYAALEQFWTALGSRVVPVDPETHDRLVARTSHIPHIAASALTPLVDGRDATPFIGSGFRDTTRVAEGRPEVWRDIALTNRAAIEAGLDEFIGTLERFRNDLKADDAEAVEAFFARGRDARLRAFEP